MGRPMSLSWAITSYSSAKMKHRNLLLFAVWILVQIIFHSFLSDSEQFERLAMQKSTRMFFISNSFTFCEFIHHTIHRFYISLKPLTFPKISSWFLLFDMEILHDCARMCGELTFSILYTEQAFRGKPFAKTTRNHAFASHILLLSAKV